MQATIIFNAYSFLELGALKLRDHLQFVWMQDRKWMGQ